MKVGMVCMLLTGSFVTWSNFYVSTPTKSNGPHGGTPFEAFQLNDVPFEVPVFAVKGHGTSISEIVFSLRVYDLRQKARFLSCTVYQVDKPSP